MSAEFIDTNIVIYCVGDDQEKRRVALALLTQRPVLSVQVLNETINIMKRKLGFDWQEIGSVILRLVQECHVVPVTAGITLSALNLAERYRYSVYDSLILAAALDAGCKVLYSEDLQHGQVIEGQLTVVNPFIGNS